MVIHPWKWFFRLLTHWWGEQSLNRFELNLKQLECPFQLFFRQHFCKEVSVFDVLKLLVFLQVFLVFFVLNCVKISTFINIKVIYWVVDLLKLHRWLHRSYHDIVWSELQSIRSLRLNQALVNSIWVWIGNAEDWTVCCTLLRIIAERFIGWPLLVYDLIELQAILLHPDFIEVLNRVPRRT